MLFKVVRGLVAVPPEGHIEKANTRTRAKISLKLKLTFFPKTVKDWNEMSEETVTPVTVIFLKTILEVCLTKNKTCMQGAC